MSRIHAREDSADLASAARLGTRRYYDRLSGWYDLLGRWERPLTEVGVDLLAPRWGERLLEVGFGTGHALVGMAEAVGPGGLVVGVDLSPGMASVARRRVVEVGLGDRVHVGLGDVRALTFGRVSFDGVFMSFVLESLDDCDIPVALAGCRRVLRPMGRVVVVALTSGRGGTLRRLYEWGHARYPTALDCRPIDVVGTLGSAGFVVTDVRSAAVARLPVDIVRATL